jgi:hypothetical protein
MSVLQDCQILTDQQIEEMKQYKAGLFTDRQAEDMIKKFAADMFKAGMEHNKQINSKK